MGWRKRQRHEAHPSGPPAQPLCPASCSPGREPSCYLHRCGMSRYQFKKIFSSFAPGKAKDHTTENILFSKISSWNTLWQTREKGRSTNGMGFLPTIPVIWNLQHNLKAFRYPQECFLNQLSFTAEVRREIGAKLLQCRSTTQCSELFHQHHAALPHL